LHNIALSTMWAIGQFPNLDDFFAAGKEMGFSRFELNHGVTNEMLSGVHLNGHHISSVHEPCPAQNSVAFLRKSNWLISSPDEENRRKGVEAIMRSIDLAYEVGASRIVVHPGKVDIDSSLDRSIYDLFRKGKMGTPEYDQAKNELMAARAQKATGNMQSVKRSILELAEAAEKKGIRLGIENRYHFMEIPLPDEMDELLNLGCGETVGFWYDLGHAQTLENLGLGVLHKEWLERFGSRITGVHLDDIIGINDHIVPGTGSLDWEWIPGQIPAGALKTLEVQPATTQDQIISGINFLISKGIS
jgi:sugar phosphate isomerase/epimerase